MDISFKQYLASKQKLREAITKTPIQTVEYVVKRYSKLPVGEDKENRNYVSLKPKQRIFVEWQYSNPTVVPKPISVRFEGVAQICENEDFQIMWSSKKLQQWLTKNTTEQTNF